MHVLTLLREFGLDPASNEAHRAVDLVRERVRWLGWDWDGKWQGQVFVGNPFFAGEVEPCINGQVMGSGAYFDQDCQRILERLLNEQLPDGGWAGVLVAVDLDELHARDGDADVFLDEHGEKVPGHWEGSPDPDEHDILTGTLHDGTVAVGKTCEDWNSEDPALFAIVGHSDGLGPNGSDDPMYRPWHSVHDSGGCHDTAPKGGAGRIYCFAVD